MAPSLPDLPAELLLMIVGDLPSSERRKTMEQLRATHPQIDEKIVHAYASEYHRSVTLHLNRESLTSFESVVSGHLGANIQSLSIDISYLIGTNVHHPKSDCVSKVRLAEIFFTFIADGSCAALLDRTLPKLQNLSSLKIHPISATTNLDFTQTQYLKRRWRIVMKVMLFAVFNHCRSLQLLNIERDDEYYHMTIPVLDVAGFSSERLLSIKNLAFDLDSGSHCGPYDTQVKVLAHFFRNTKSLSSLNIGFQRYDGTFFDEWSKNAPQTNLTRLHLDHVSTEYKYWAAYIRSCGENLQSFSMNGVYFARPGEHQLIFQFLASRTLSRCVLRNTYVDDKLLFFDKLYKSMPKTRSEYRKAPDGVPGGDNLVEVPRTKYPSYELHLYNSHDGDDEVKRGLDILLGLASTNPSALFSRY